jgi:hypothetical protein
MCDERLGDAFNDLTEHFLNSIDRPIDFRFFDNERWRQANGVPVSCPRGIATLANVRLWHKADIPIGLMNVRFWG